MDHSGQVAAIRELAKTRIQDERTREALMHNIEILDPAELNEHFSEVMENIEEFGEKARMLDDIDRAIDSLESSSKDFIKLNKELGKVEQKYDELSARSFLDSSFI